MSSSDLYPPLVFTVNDFVRLLSQLPGPQVDAPFRGGSGSAEELATDPQARRFYLGEQFSL